MQLLALLTASALFRPLLKLNTADPRPRPLRTELRRALHEQLREDVEDLGDVLGRDLSVWSETGGVHGMGGDS